MAKFDIKDVFQPKLFSILKSGTYNKKTFSQDLISGLIVGVVAIPLAIAFGIASGVSPQQGLLTSILAGFIIAIFGGSHVQIGGSTGAFIIIISGIIGQYGFTGLVIATVLAGIILLIMAILKLGDVIKFMPYPIIVGFTSGISLVIFSTQIKDFFGLTNPDGTELILPSDFLSEWVVYFQNFSSINIWATALALLAVIIGFTWQKVTKIIPGSLVSLILCTVIAIVLKNYFDIELTTIGSKYPELSGGAPLPSPKAPNITIKAVTDLISPAFTIAVLCAIESLMSAMIADGAIGKKHHSNTELVGLGIANIIIPFFGGIPATSSLARTMANINNGGKTPVAGIVHSVFLLLVFLFLMPLAAHIPFACLAGILVIVAYNMSEWRSFKSVLNNPKSDVLVMLVTFFLTIFFGLTTAIVLGLLIAAFLFIKRVMDNSAIKVVDDELARTENLEIQDIEYEKIPKEIEVYEINGPFFFGIANRFDEISYETKSKKPKVRIIRMRRVPFVDSTGLKNLKNLCKKSKKEKIQIILSGVTPEVYETLEKSEFVSYLGEEFIFDHISKAMDKAYSLIGK